MAKQMDKEVYKSFIAYTEMMHGHKLMLWQKYMLCRMLDEKYNVPKTELNRSNLNKFIKWTSSKFNEFKKSEVINAALKLKPLEHFECRCGSYAEGAYNGGLEYHFLRYIKELVVFVNGDYLKSFVVKKGVKNGKDK